MPKKEARDGAVQLPSVPRLTSHGQCPVHSVFADSSRNQHSLPAISQYENVIYLVWVTFSLYHLKLWLVSQHVNKIVFRAYRVATCMQSHLSTYGLIRSCTTSDGEHRIRPIVVVGAFNRDLTIG